MTKIVGLQSCRVRALEQKSFGPWQRRFGEPYGAHTRISDLSDKTLFSLAQPGENSTTAFYELIMGNLDLGPAGKFYYLVNDEQMRVVDVHLLLADHVRFEMMRRLGWLKTLPCSRYSLIEMVQRFDAVKQQARQAPPELNDSHPEYVTASRKKSCGQNAWPRLTNFRSKIFSKRKGCPPIFRKGPQIKPTKETPLRRCANCDTDQKVF